MKPGYYLKNIIWGALFFILFLYQWYTTSQDNTYKYLMIFSAISFPLFPLSKKAIEDTALKVTKKEFWHKGIFKDDIGKNGLYAIYYSVCFVLAIPIGIPYLIYLIIKKAAR